MPASRIRPFLSPTATAHIIYQSSFRLDRKLHANANLAKNCFQKPIKYFHKKWAQNSRKDIFFAKFVALIYQVKKKKQRCNRCAFAQKSKENMI